MNRELGTLTRLSTAELAKRIRQHSVRMTGRANASSIASSLSAADIVAALYNKALRCDPQRPDWSGRDRFIMSKGHASTALYAALAECGFFPLEWLEGYYQDGSLLGGHVTHQDVPGVDLSTGSLGHGLGVGAGMALAAKRDRNQARVFCLLGDGECDEGSVWEAALFAPQHRLDNLVAIVDYNKFQAMGRVNEVLDLEPLAGKWRTFGWAARELDGHDIPALEDALREVPYETGRPSCIVAHTVKGKGVTFMENNLQWHYRAPVGDDMVRALKELEQAR